MKILSRLTVAAAILSLSATALAAEKALTFAEHIAPLIHRNCTGCHRPGQAGPFSLITYDDVRGRAATIESVVEDRYMPPWKAVHEPGMFAGERRLSDAEIQLIRDWVAAGSPEGDASKTPAPPEYPDGWSLGKPDLVVKMKGEFAVSADGPDVYRSFVFPVGLDEDKWVTAIELRPQARGSVHHGLFFLDTSGEARKLDGRDGQAGFSGMSFLRGDGGRGLFGALGGDGGGLGGYVPGTTPKPLPLGLARRLPKGADIVMQTHFHPSGKAEVEQAELAIYFAEKPPSRQIVPIQVPPLFGAGAGIDIPAGEKNYTVTDRFEIPIDVEAVAVSGHAHYICREMKMVATLPDGSRRDLLKIDDWDLDWQDSYIYREPIRLPAGTAVETTLIYDNSKDNPENPNHPPRRIRWGRESDDEMGCITLTVVAAEESERTRLEGALRRHVISGLAGRGGVQLPSREALLRRYDANKNGKLERGEVPEIFRSRLFDRADANGDGVLDEDEF